MTKTWIVDVHQDEQGEHFIQFTDEMLEETDLKVGDIVEWIDNKDGTWTMKKKEQKTVWVMVDAISQYRMRYLVEVPADHPEYALDTVTCEEAKEFSQHWLGEVISSHRVVTQEEALKICDEDNSYCSSWSDEQKIKTFFTKDGEKVEL